MIASNLERGKFFEHKGEIVQVVRKSLVNVGTHSHTKLVFTVCDIYGKREREVVMGHNDRVDDVDVVKKKATVISKSDKVQIMDIQTYETLDAECDRDILETLIEGDEVGYIDYKGVKVLGKRKNQEK